MATSIGKRAYIGPVPDTRTLAAFQAVAWAQIKGTVSVGSFGFPHATVDVPELETGITKTYKGARQGSGGEIAYRTIALDPGQVAVGAANAGRGEVAMRVDSPDGTTADFHVGIIHSLVPNPSDTSSYEGWTCTFVPNEEPVIGAPSSGP